MALGYNWWPLFVRLAQPHKPFEAVSSRLLLLQGVAVRGTTRLTITSLHAKRSAIQAVLTNWASFLKALNATAEQWTEAERLRVMLTRAFATFMCSPAGPPPVLI